MKKNLSYLLVSALMIFTSISCSKDGKENPTPGQAEFSFTLSDLKSALKSAKADTVTNVSAIVLTIEDLSGKVLYNNEKVELYNMNGYYISKPLSLVPGGYKLSKFLVVDASNTVVYATPTEGSTKAYLVNDPLPILFSVTKDIVTKVVPEVISVKNSTPEDFGYATFSFTEVATFDFLIGVFVYNESIQNFEMTTAHLSVAADSGWVYEKEVAAATDTITVKDNQIKYILTVTKDGYETWTDTLSADELKLQYSSEDKGPLKVILFKNNTKEITFTTDQSTLKKVITVFNGTPGKKIFIDWGDNSISDIYYFENYSICFSNHQYQQTGIYTIKMIGDVDEITYIDMPNNQLVNTDLKYANKLKSLNINTNKLNNLNISNSPELDSLLISVNNITHLDLSKNNKLRRLYYSDNKITNIDISNLNILESLDLSNNPINTIDVSNNTLLTELMLRGTSISAINLYNNSKLELLELSQTLIYSLDVSNNQNLKVFSIFSPNLTSLDVTLNTNLELLYIGSPIISTISLSNNNKLKRLAITANNITSIDISQNVELNYLSLATAISSLDLSNQTKITLLGLGSNKNLSNIDVTNQTELKSLSIEQTNISSLDISKNTKLEFLQAYSTKLTSLDVSNNDKLSYLTVHYDPIPSNEMDTILTTLLNNVTNHPRKGVFGYSQLTGQSGSNAINNLTANYNWAIYKH